MRSEEGIKLKSMRHYVRMISGRLREWDELALIRISESPYLQPFAPLFSLLSYLGEGYLWGIVGLFLILFGGEADRRYVLIGLCMTLTNIFIYTILKFSFKRRRPTSSPNRFTFLGLYSFPSGHSSVAFGIAFMISYFYPFLWLQLIAYFTAFLISLSRIYVRDHYPSDSLFGAILGTLLTYLLLPLFLRIVF